MISNIHSELHARNLVVSYRTRFGTVLAFVRVHIGNCKGQVSTKGPVIFTEVAGFKIFKHHAYLMGKAAFVGIKSGNNGVIENQVFTQGCGRVN